MKPTSWRGVPPLRMLLTACVLASTLTVQAQTSAPNRYSQWMTASEMKRTPHSYRLDFQSNKKWAYAIGIECEAMLDTYLAYGDDAILAYVWEFPDACIDANGGIYKYKMSDYNLDNIRPARLLLHLRQAMPTLFTPQAPDGYDKYTVAVQTLYQQLAQHPRTSDSIWWHKQTYHDQVWLDGLFMGIPFYTLGARLGLKEAVGEERPDERAAAIYDDAVAQLLKAAAHTYDDASGTWRHAYDESRTLFWSDAVTGRSAHSWGRAQGWMAMAIVELLDVLPADHPRRGEVVDLLSQMMTALVRYQDAETGLWRLVTDVTDRPSENYLEATCSAMFTYVLLKGHRLGDLDDALQASGLKGYQGIINHLIKKNADGTISLTDCCSVGGLGPESNPKRDGSFEYYISESRRDNDGKGVGPFIWASLEMERLGYDVTTDYTSPLTSLRPIERLRAGEPADGKACYDLWGRRIPAGRHGLYISEGRILSR